MCPSRRAMDPVVSISMAVTTTSVPFTVEGSVDRNYIFDVLLDQTSDNVTFLENSFTPPHVALHVVSGRSGGGQPTRVPSQPYAPAGKRPGKTLGESPKGSAAASSVALHLPCGLEETHDVALAVLEVRREAHVADGLLLGDRLPACLLDLLKGLVDVGHADGDHDRF
jgi:hypothetical protein